MRRLVFGWVEVLPTCFPPMRGHPFRSPKARRSELTFYVARFPMTAFEAERWFDAAARGDLRLPSHPDKPTQGDLHRLQGPPFTREPENGGQSSALVLPFLPLVHGVMLTTGLFGKDDRGFAKRLLESPDAVWLRENMFIDLSNHPEYLGSLVFTRHHPVVRDVGSRLGARDGREIELVRIRRWPGTDLDGCKVLAVEQRLLGMGKPVDIPVRSSVLELDWNGKSDKTALSVVHRTHGLAWWREPLGFLRSIRTNLGLIHETRRIVQEIGEDGTVLKSYDTDWRGGKSQTLVSLVGDDTEGQDPSDRAWRAEAHRKRLRIAASLGLRWFDNAGAAQDAVRAIIHAARTSFQVIDAYFGPKQVRDFALAVSAGDVSISIVTSEECLLSDTRGGAEKEFSLMERTLSELPGKGWAKPEVRVMRGRRAPLHDRFLVADGRVWLSGNSLSAIGKRASVLIEIPNPQEVLGHLKPIVDDATPFSDWLAKQRTTGTGTDQVAGEPTGVGSED